MKKILYIARNELYTLFFSPIAWVMMILFMILTGLDYLGVMDRMIGDFERGGPSLMGIGNLTIDVSSNPIFGYFPKVIKNLYIYFPLITMGLVAREASSGTIKLLYSSPIRIREVVLGKYLAIICFTACLLLVLFATIVAFCISTVNPDYGQLIVSLFGLFMVLATYAAIGLFMSSLTSYPIVAAIITLAVFSLLTNIGSLWQDIDVVRNITDYLNIGEKSFNLISGLFNLRDFSYFTIIICSFVLFTMIRIKTGTESISRGKKIMRYATVVIIAGVIGYVTSNPYVNFYFDATRNNVHTISNPTREMLAKLNDGELEVTAYANLMEGSYGRFNITEQNRVTRNRWEPYIRFKPDINVKYVYYYDCDSTSDHYKLNPGKSMKEIAIKRANSYRIDLDHFLPPEEVNKLTNTRAEEFRSFFILKYKNRTTALRVFDDNDFWPKEEEIAAAINRLVETPPKIGFVTGEIERGPFSERGRDYKGVASLLGFRYSLINQGYDFDTLSLDKPIPPGYAAIAIADPRVNFKPEGLENIYKYIDAGENLLLLTEPDRREVTAPILNKLGITLRNEMIIQPSDMYSSDMAFTHMTKVAQNISPQYARALKDDTKYYGDTVFKVALPGSSVLDYTEKDGFTIEPLLATDNKLSWNRITTVDKDSLQLKVAKQPADQTGTFVTSIRMHRNINGKEQRIIVVSDADYMSKAHISPKPVKGMLDRRNNKYSFWNTSYFSYGKFPANTLRPEPLDNAFRVPLESVEIQRTILIYIIPAIIAVACTVILIRRKRK